MQCKSVTAILFIVVDPTPKTNQTAIAVPTGTPSRPIIPPSLLCNFLWSRMNNISRSISTNRDLWYRAYLWITRRRTGIVESTTSIHSDFVINLIMGRYFFCRRCCVCCERITETIHSESFLESPDFDKLVVVVPLKPTAKHFPTFSNHHPHSNSSKNPYPTKPRQPELL